MQPRIGFVTCVELGRACIEEVVEAGGRFSLLVTLEDRIARNKSGRARLDDLAQRYDMPLLKIRHINDAATVHALKAARLDWLFIIGWSQVASPDVLTSAGNGVLGMHPTLLPEGRGRASVPWAILKGLKQTGVTLFVLDEGVDTGPIVEQLQVPIGERETATSLYRRVAVAHRDLIRKVWPVLMNGNVKPSAQDDSAATVWPGRSPEDGEVRPEMSVEEVDRLVRATTRPYPGAFLERDGEVYTLWAGMPLKRESFPEDGLVVHCADGKYIATDYELRNL